MIENRFVAAAWASVATAVLLPTAFIIAGIEGATFGLRSLDQTVGIGVADYLFLILGAVGIYVLLSLKKLMYERYSFRGLDLVIVLAIVWTIVNYGGSFVLELLYASILPAAVKNVLLMRTIFWIVCIAGFGILDMIIGLILVCQWRRFSMALRVFAILSMVAGFFEATVILSFFALLFYPLALIALAFAFFKPEEVVEFV